MFYKLIARKRDEWLCSKECAIGSLVAFIQSQGKMRDAQVEAIKTYLYLKIACGSRPLWQLLTEGRFNIPIDFDRLEVSTATRRVLQDCPAALALWQFATMKDEGGNRNAPKVEQIMRRQPEAIDYEQVFRDIFFGINYPDYLFSIPMGAGKTYLMAAFIYIDLYFALSEPDNPAFAHNFILFVPSGLKSSIIPSLRDIQNFDPHWILPDPVASQLKSLIKYEWLQEDATGSKSNLVRNPNARKIAMHLATPGLMGLVAVTNAEKVILNKADKDFNIDDSLFSTLPEAERKAILEAREQNELRTQIGHIPHLCILIDEVHHASEDQLLRRVVNRWMEQENFNAVLGFSGTPFMDPAVPVRVSDEVAIKQKQYANVVDYYPLIDGLGNFLKTPVVRHTDLSSAEIIDKGLREFLDKYRDVEYAGGVTAKIAIYAPNIATLEEEVYPQVSAICADYGFNPSEAVLRYHRGDTKNKYKAPEDAQLEFSTLDSPLSRKRIVLLVQIGREGWNCKSLTSVILSQQGVCPQNMVLQTACRCLREVDNAQAETALIWLGKFNADKLNDQLVRQQYTTLEAFSSQKPHATVSLQRHSRMERLRVPPIDYYQMGVSYAETIIDDPTGHISERLASYTPPLKAAALITTQNLRGENVAFEPAASYESDQKPPSFGLWLHILAKESFGTLQPEALQPYLPQLKSIYDRLTTEHDQPRARADIRCMFVPRRTFSASEELIPEQARLLRLGAPSSPIEADKDRLYKFVPDQEEVERIVTADQHPDVTFTPEQIEQFKAFCRATGATFQLPSPVTGRTYHYLPYHLDSRLEADYFGELRTIIETYPKVEFYFNGDESLTEFSIRCYKRQGHAWKCLGDYYPDFLLLTRTAEGAIHRVIIVETKGEGFAAKFADRKTFMEQVFIARNNEQAGYPRFQFLYIPDTLSHDERILLTKHHIDTFLNEN